MTDFAERSSLQETDFIIRSLMDVDFYKLTMGYYIFKKHRGVNVKFRLINRDQNVPLGFMIDEQELREQLDHVRTLGFRRTDLYYLRGMDVYGENMFDEEYIEFLSTVRLPDYHLEMKGPELSLTFEGPWEQVTFWETIALAIVSELYYRKKLRKMTSMDRKVLYANATSKLYNKLKFIKENAPNAKITDFGQRRRHSFLWQKFAIEMASDVLGDQFVGTSNTWLAFNQDKVPIGTNAHELPMVVTALYPDELKPKAQYDIVREWGTLFGKGLRIVLPDTYGSTQFFKGMPRNLAEEIATNWRGIRQDSGSPEVEANMFFYWLRDHDVDPREKACIFSDGLDYENIVNLQTQFEGQMITPFGWGTALTNDFINCDPSGEDRFRSFSLVCKVLEADGKPAVKLSNNPKKATGIQSEIAKYLKIFGNDGKTEMETRV